MVKQVPRRQVGAVKKGEEGEGRVKNEMTEKYILTYFLLSFSCSRCADTVRL